MSRKSLLRAGGMLTAGMLMLAQLAAMPVTASEVTSDDISVCNYVLRYDTPVTVARDNGVAISLDDIGVAAGQTPKQVWLEIAADASQGLPTMPAYGYSAPGCGDYDWYSDGVWIQEPSSKFTVKLDVSEEYALPGQFEVQIWGEAGETLDSFDLTAVGVLTGDGGSIGTMTRKGDLNGDKTADLADAVALAKFLIGEITELEQPANGDLDHNNRLNGKDLTLLKRGLLDGSIGGTSSSDETALEFVSHLKLGWNLGNTLDGDSWKSNPTVNDYETGWGCPTTTKAMIDAVKAAGFNTVRIPVSWGKKCSGDNYTINEDWMNRVQEIVNYAIDDGMYVFLNMHHDNEQISNNAYFYPDSAHLENSLKFVSSVWTQIATRFEGYDNHLIFETLNEPRLVGTSLEWNGGDSASRAIVNQLNAAALEAIRATGGNNAKRFVMMPGYAAAPDAAVINDIVLPDDDHLIVSIHAYRPYSFALDTAGTSSWSESSYNDTNDINDFMSRVHSKFIANGVPVVIGEMGAMNKNNEDIRAAWAKYYVTKATSYGIPCVWWDNNAFNGSGENFGLFNRNTLQIEYPKIMEALLEGAAGRG